LPVAEAPNAERADLDDIRAAGLLRMIVRRQELETLPGEWGDGPPALQRARGLAEKIGVAPQLILVSSPPEAFRALLEHRGDAVMPDVGLTPSDTTGLKLSQPKVFADAVVVVGDSAPEVPARLEDLAGRTLGVQTGSDFVDLLADLEPEVVSAIETMPVAEVRDTEELLRRVGLGELDATIAYRDDVDAYLAVNDDVRVAFTLRENVPAHWIVRERSTALLEAINGFVYSHAMTKHRRDRYDGTLAEIRRRGVLRVGMLNNGASYFLYRGMELGFQYELAKLAARRLGVRLEPVVPPRPEEMHDLLEEGSADIIPVTQISSNMATTVPLSFADYLIVQRSDAPPIERAKDLRGKTVHVRRSSAYAPRLEELARQIPDLTIAYAPEELETEDLIAQVAGGVIELTASNSVLLGVELTYRDDVQGTLVLEEKRPLLWAVRADAPALLAKVNEIVHGELRHKGIQRLRRKYFERDERMAEMRSEESSVSGRISPFDDIVRRYARRYGLDWRLMLAQMYQESRFDPKITSWVGAVGLMQIMPTTGRQLGFSNLTDPETNIHAGAMYMAQLIAQFEPTLPMRQRVRFALASYNAGTGHVQDARRLAQRRGLDPDRWFGNVEKAIVLLEKRRYYQRARHGYCRGSEPAGYVSRIQTKYDAYSALMPADGPRDLGADPAGSAESR
jgi:membrane-bound lytic murein transglycosylase F